MNIKLSNNRLYITTSPSTQTLHYGQDQVSLTKINQDTFSMSTSSLKMGEPFTLYEDGQLVPTSTYQVTACFDKLTGYHFIDQTVKKINLKAQQVPMLNEKTKSLDMPMAIEDELAYITLPNSIRPISYWLVSYTLGNETMMVDYHVNQANQLVIAKKYLDNRGLLLLSNQAQSWSLNDYQATPAYENLSLSVNQLGLEGQTLVMQLAPGLSINQLAVSDGHQVYFGEETKTAHEWRFALDAFPLRGAATFFVWTQDALAKITELTLEDEATSLQSSSLQLVENRLYMTGQESLYLMMEANDFKKAPKLKVKVTEVGDETITFSHALPTTSQWMGVIIKTRKEDVYFAQTIMQKDETYVLEMKNFMAKEQLALASKRYDLYAVLAEKGVKKVYQLTNQSDLPKEKQERFYPMFQLKTEELASLYYPQMKLYLTTNNELAIVKNTVSNLIKEQFSIKTELSKFEYKKPKVQLEIKLNLKDKKAVDFLNVSLAKRNKDSFNVIDLPITQTHSKKENHFLTATLDYSKDEFEPLYWDIYVKVKINGRKEYIRINKASEIAINNIKNNTLNYQYRTADNYLMYPYVTLGGDVSFTYRAKEYFETPKNNFKEKMAYYTAKLFKSQLAKKDIWIGFEKLAESAHDSGYHFFNYCYQNKKHDHYYYVIRKGAQEEQFLADKKNRVLHYMSFKYFVYLFSASLLVSSDTKRNVYNLKQKETLMGRALADKPLIYLQHGVNGLKKVPDFYKDRNVFDLVIAPSDYERQLIIDEWGYHPDEVATTGLARWDVMEDKTASIDYRQIFVMPTWRTWMDGMTDEQFLASNYFQQYNEFLSSPKLKDLLLANNCRIAFFLHPKFKNYVHLFDIDESIISKYEFLEVPLDEMIMKSSMMISDYSSIIWEMYYLKRPCVFYQFDKTQYLAYEGMYMDPDKDLFGDAVFTSSEVINQIETYIERDFVEKETFAQMRPNYFNLMDHHNSERIYKAIQVFRKKFKK